MLSIMAPASLAMSLAVRAAASRISIRALPAIRACKKWMEAVSCLVIVCSVMPVPKAQLTLEMVLALDVCLGILLLALVQMRTAESAQERLLVKPAWKIKILVLAALMDITSRMPLV